MLDNETTLLGERVVYLVCRTIILLRRKVVYGREELLGRICQSKTNFGIVPNGIYVDFENDDLLLPYCFGDCFYTFRKKPEALFVETLQCNVSTGI